MGTNLSQRGCNPTPVSNLKNSETVKQITKEYIKAGSDIVETNTFSATSLKFKQYKKINILGVEIARQAVLESGRKNVKIAGCVGPTGKMVEPIGELEFEQAVNVFKSQIKILSQQGVDMLIIETMDDISQMRAALIAAKETAPGLKVISTMTFSEKDRTSTGTPPEVACRVMECLGSSVIGVNCSYGPEGLLNVISRMKRVTDKPLIVQANAGIPYRQGSKTVYPLKPEEFAEKNKQLAKKGASYIGGCCGTDSSHIRAVIKKLKNIKPDAYKHKQRPLIISSRANWVEFGDFPVVVGERINFIANKRLTKSKTSVLNEGLKQKKAGADALDVNLGKQEEKSWEITDMLERKVGLPIVLDSQNAEQVEKVARKYPGIILLNSISGEKSKLESLLPIVKKYGIPFIGLCVDDKGVPKTIKRKIEISRKIIEKAEKQGIDKSNIIIDYVVFSISTDTDTASKTLKAVSKSKNYTILGISNVSAGFPQRALINETFSALAVSMGCSAVIVNPLDRDLMYMLYCSALLSGRDKNGEKYLEYFSPKQETFKFKQPLRQAILEGNTEKAVKEINKSLEKKSAVQIINQDIVKALDKVGELYSKRYIFLPQLIESARASQESMALLQRKMQKSGEKSKTKEKIIIATVKGDIHDIGKNLVVLMLKNHSFEVKDMGVDVDSKKIVNEAKKLGARVICLSSLMTTTMDRMSEVVQMLKKEKLNIPVLIGGAAVTKKYAKSIDAEYAGDAVEAVNAVKKLVAK